MRRSGVPSDGQPIAPCEMPGVTIGELGSNSFSFRLARTANWPHECQRGRGRARLHLGGVRDLKEKIENFYNFEVAREITGGELTYSLAGP